MGVILAGGRGSRFGGVDKSFLELQGRPLIEHLIARIAPQVRELLINTNSADSRFRATGLRLIADQSHDKPATGPLLGITSVFQALEESGDDESDLLTVPVDTPFLPTDLVQRLAAARSESEATVAYAATAVRAHPVVALWAVRSRPLLQALFHREPTISLHGVMRALHASRVEFAHSPRDPFFNINSAEDLEAADRLLEPTQNV